MIDSIRDVQSDVESAAGKAGALLSKAGQEIRSAGRNTWLAGLGAVASADREGRDLFARLVERGRPMAEKQKEALSDLGDKAGKAARGFGQLMTDTLEYEVRGALKRFGVATRKDFTTLEARLETLAREIDGLDLTEDLDA